MRGVTGGRWKAQGGVIRVKTGGGAIVAVAAKQIRCSWKGPCEEKSVVQRKADGGALRVDAVLERGKAPECGGGWDAALARNSAGPRHRVQVTDMFTYEPPYRWCFARCATQRSSSGKACRRQSTAGSLDT